MARHVRTACITALVMLAANLALAAQQTQEATIFGQVTEGYDVVESIARVPTGAQDRPRDDVVIERIDIAD